MPYKLATTRTGRRAGPAKGLVVTMDGKLELTAASFGKFLGRPVIVPEKLRGKTIRNRTLKGTPEEIAGALGLELGPKRRKLKAL
jgi:hypothetical protein